MVAQSVTTARPASRPVHGAVSQLLSAVGVTITAMLLLLAAWLLVRRAGGQLQQPLSWFGLTIAATALVVLVSIVRLIWLRTNVDGRSGVRARLLWGSLSAVVLVLALSLSITGTGSVGLLFLWGILLVAELAWWYVDWRGRPVAGSTVTAPVSSRQVAAAAGSPAAAAAAGDISAESEEADDQLPEDVCQQITRSWAEEEKDTVMGVLRARFDPKERSRSLHVAFCPPMLHRPAVTVVQLAGARTRIKAADIRPFGIRFDLRLAAASEDVQEVLMHFEARCGKPASGGIQAS